MYGTGQHPKSHVDEHRYLHVLNEAMIIDMSFAGNNEEILEKENYTSLLLFSLYDFAHSVQHQDYTLPSVSEEIPIEDFSNFSQNVETCIDSGRQWIELNRDADTDVKTYQLYHGWCSALSQQFVINYVYLTKQKFQNQKKQNQLLSAIGFYSCSPKVQELFQEFDISLETVEEFECTLDNRKCIIPVGIASSACSERPMAEACINID